MRFFVKPMVWAGMILLLQLFASAGQETQRFKKIIVKTFYSQERAQKVLETLVHHLNSYPRLRQLQKEKGFRYVARPSGRYYIVAVEPLDKESLRAVLPIVRRRFPDAFANRYYPPTPQSVEESATAQEQELPAEANVERKKAESAQKASPSEEVTTPVPPVALPEAMSEPAPKQEMSEKMRETKKVQEPIAQEEATPPLSAETVPRAETLPSEVVTQTAEEIASAQEPSARQADAPKLPAPAQAKDGASSRMPWYLLALLAGLGTVAGGWFFYKKRAAREDASKKRGALSGLVEQMDQPFISAMETLNSSIQALQRRMDGDEQTAKQFETMERAGKRMEIAWADMKDIALLATGVRPHNYPRRFDLNDILEQLAETFKAEEISRDVGITYDVDTQMPIRYIGDSKRLKRTLYHALFASALRMRQGGCIYLSVREEQEERDENESRTRLIWKLVCRSEGPLTAPDEEVLWHADLSARLAEAMGAQTDLLEDERGLIWKMGLPIEIFDAKNRRKYHLPSRAYMKKRVYIVDPDRVAAKSLEKMLRFFHYDIHYLASLAERDRRQKEPWDLLFIDEKALREDDAVSMEELKSRIATKVIVIARPGHLERVRYEFAEADAFLQRPFTHRQLLGLLVRQFGQSWY